MVVPGSADQVVPWWSFTKTVVAVAALALVDAGRLSLDGAVDGAPYTLRQLLRHEAGLPDYGGLPAYHQAVAQGDVPWSREDLRTAVEAGRLRYPPGVGWAYSNIGYRTVRERVEAAMGQPLGETLDRLVLQPLGLKHARLAETPADLTSVEMGSAAGYHPGWVYHGLLVGPLSEAALLLDRLSRLLPPSWLAAMRTLTPLPQFASPLHPAPSYGLGLMSPYGDAARACGHNGGGPGSSIAVYRFEQTYPARTVAVFGTVEDEAVVEAEALRRGES